MNLREWALPVYTIMIQLATGAILSLWVIRLFGIRKFGRDALDRMTKIPMLIIFSTIILAMVGAHFHLSKPFLSILAVLNYRTSWLSREIIFTIVFFLITGCLSFLLWYVRGYHRVKEILGWIAILAGVIDIYCMAHIYLLPTQISWNSPATIPTYYGTTLLLGATSLASILLIDLNFSEVQELEGIGIRTEIVRKAILWLTATAVLAAALVVSLNLYQIAALRDSEYKSAQISLHLLLDLYQPLLMMRFGLLLLGVGWLVTSIMSMALGTKAAQELIGSVYLSCMLVMTAEILQRFLFFATHVRIGV